MKQRLIEPDFAKIMDFLDKGNAGDCICLDFSKSRWLGRGEEVGQGGDCKGR